MKRRKRHWWPSSHVRFVGGMAGSDYPVMSHVMLETCEMVNAPFNLVLGTLGRVGALNGQYCLLGNPIYNL